MAGLDAQAPDLEARVEEGKKQFAGVELPHRTLGIVGLGAIGSLVADTAIKLGMKVIGFDPEITVDAAWRLPSSVRRAHGIEELLKQSDFVTLHVPLLPVTRKLHRCAAPRGHEAGAVLLNFARDGIVDEDAVLDALRGAAPQGVHHATSRAAQLAARAGRRRAAAPRRVDRGSRGELRGHGGRSGARVSGARAHRATPSTFPTSR